MKDLKDPYNSLCAIHVQTTGLQSEKVEGTASGILIDHKHGYVLTHASLIYPLHEHFHHNLLRNLRVHGSSKLNSKIFDANVSLEVILPNPQSDAEDTVQDDDKTIQPVLLGNSVQTDSLFTKYKGRVKIVFESKRLRDVIQKMMPKENWTFEADNGEDEDNLKVAKKKNEDLFYFLLPCFVLIQLKDPLPRNVKFPLSFRDSLSNMIGDRVEICATPFGSMSPDAFLNSRSRGIISKIAGQEKVLLMTDARCVPGCEGGGLFYAQRGERILTGMMIASLCWKNNEWVGLSLACSISELLGVVQDTVVIDVEPHMPKQPYFLNATNGPDFVSTMMSRVCYIAVGTNWGSGVSLDGDGSVFLTCSHVLKGSDISVVRVTEARHGTTASCDVVYRTQPGRQFDVGVIRNMMIAKDRTGIQHLNIGRVKEGDVVYVVGHAIFRNDLDLSPVITRGIVSKINRCGRKPVMIQTTCAVHAGASGGGVFNTRGQLVAMVVCNSRDTVSGAFYPHVNMCVPMETIAPALSEYLRTNDPGVLEHLEIDSKDAHLIWNIGSQGDVLSSRL